MDLNISKYVVFHGDFESAVQMNPSIAQKSKKRPLLFKKNIGETIGKIYFERKKIYSEADFKVRCDKLKTDTIVNKILKIYENA